MNYLFLNSNNSNIPMASQMFPDFMKKQYFEFRKLYRNWFKEMSDNCPEQKKDIIKFYKDHMEDDDVQLIDLFFSQIRKENYLDLLVEKDMSLFHVATQFYVEFHYVECMRSASPELRESQMKYLTKLTYMAIMLQEHSGEMSKAATTEDDIPEVEEKPKSNLDVYGPYLMKLLANIQEIDGVNMESFMQNMEETMKKQAESGAGGSGGGIPGMPGDFFQKNPLLTEIAEEISKEIVIPEDFKNIKNPGDIFGMLFNKSGKGFMEKMVQTVGSKIQNRISTGQITEKELMEQAQQMMGSVFQNNPMFSGMANMMGGGAPGSSSGTSGNQQQKQQSDAERKAELRKKLKEKIRK
jgi:hypothetical protein